MSASERTPDQAMAAAIPATKLELVRPTPEGVVEQKPALSVDQVRQSFGHAEMDLNKVQTQLEEMKSFMATPNVAPELKSAYEKLLARKTASEVKYIGLMGELDTLEQSAAADSSGVQELRLDGVTPESGVFRIPTAEPKTEIPSQPAARELSPSDQVALDRLGLGLEAATKRGDSKTAEMLQAKMGKIYEGVGKAEVETVNQPTARKEVDQAAMDALGAALDQAYKANDQALIDRLESQINEAYQGLGKVVEVSKEEQLNVAYAAGDQKAIDKLQTEMRTDFDQQRVQRGPDADKSFAEDVSKEQHEQKTGKLAEVGAIELELDALKKRESKIDASLAEIHNLELTALDANERLQNMRHEAMLLGAEFQVLKQEQATLADKVGKESGSKAAQEAYQKSEAAYLSFVRQPIVGGPFDGVTHDKIWSGDLEKSLEVSIATLKGQIEAHALNKPKLILWSWKEAFGKDRKKKTEEREAANAAALKLWSDTDAQLKQELFLKTGAKARAGSYKAESHARAMELYTQAVAADQKVKETQQQNEVIYQTKTEELASRLAEVGQRVSRTESQIEAANAERANAQSAYDHRKAEEDGLKIQDAQLTAQKRELQARLKKLQAAT